MKIFYFKLLMVLTLFIFGYIELQGQAANSNLNEERVSLFTDRTLYIAGEQIQFAALLFTNSSFNKSYSANKSPLSNIIYTELIGPEGEKIAKGKYLCEKDFCKGIITIPNDIITGNYYIRAYTKFMRNNGPATYSYIRLKIVNPIKEDVLSYTNVKTPSKDSMIFGNNVISEDLFTISLDKAEYSTRERVNVHIKENVQEENPLKNINLTVIPESSYIECNTSLPLVNKPSNNQLYFPETDGLSLTGNLKDSKSGNPLPNRVVNLSILGSCKDFMATLTDSAGRFFFKMPVFTGSKDVFLCTEMLEDSKSKILIDNDFCANEVKLPALAFQLTDLERKAAYNMALNVQIASHFNKPAPKDSLKYANKAFYGEPKIKLVFDTYIQLPTMEDYINELIPLLKVRKHHKKKHFKIYSAQSEPEMEIYKPLVLLDLVAIDDPEKILSLPPQAISRIELIDVPYIKGDVTYGGIISIFSKKGDFAGIDLPSSGVFLDFNFLTDCDLNLEEPLTANRPDARNTLLWEPTITLSYSHSKEVSFTTPDTPGRYIILLRGITSNGKVFAYKQPFFVKN